MTTEEHVKVSSSYHFDAFLMYHIQDVTKKPTAEILNFFYELANAVTQMGFQAKKGRGGIDKQIDDYYPGTSVPFHMRIKGSARNWEYDKNGYQTLSVPKLFAQVEVGFPTQNVYMDSKQLDDAAVAIMEKALLGGDGVADIAPFQQPEPRASRMYKKLMDEFAGRPVVEKKPRKKKVKKVECVFCGHDDCTGCQAGGSA